MSDSITITGLVATSPRHIVTSEGLPLTTFRVASTQRRYDRSQERWIDGETNWYSITTFRQLAINSAASISKGERVVVTGKLRIRDWTNGERTGTNIDIEAEALGHDLMWGTTTFSRGISRAKVDDTDDTDNAVPVEGGADAQEFAGVPDPAEAEAVVPF